jgi:creatinine amidohydrolase
MPEVDPTHVRNEHRYELLTWPEINEAVRQEKVVVLPIGAIEQHGHHLPLDVDAKLGPSICEEAGRRAPESMLIMPTQHYGYCHHVMDFPGTISLSPTTFVTMLIEIGTSLAYHGFRKIVFINGHGSNHHLVDQAARQINLTTDATCLMISWWQLIADFWNEEVRESGPGGCAHACELETSVYMHIDDAHVHRDRIVGKPHSFLTDIPGGERWQKVDLTLSSGPVSIVEWTSITTDTGSMGNPELATAEKGERTFERAVEELIEMVQWFQKRPLRERVDLHDRKPGFDLPFRF